ncbi:hypothetical protein LTR56_014310 [Elasticomyces elasticus]|nr:hypothetical protein LTR22_024716 [Elasticomyces elasticus]KAK3636147.1 hypothetical protein LTR56_014310 [Elasticomyces elasticus]KAK4916566.1 hypothetical protein LTR49_015399 [Elasticomyces elasticus]KAK5756197.1 hypothetical protein LTS12_013750 [Elasticomyces elasticus]
MPFPKRDGFGGFRGGRGYPGGRGGSAGTKRPAVEESNNDNTTKRSKKRTFFGLPANLPRRNGSSESPVSSGSLEAHWLELDQEMEQVVDSTPAAAKSISFSDYRNRAKEKAAVPPTPAQAEQSQSASTEAAQVVASGTTSPIISPEKTTAPRDLTHHAPARPFNHDTSEAGSQEQCKTPITPRTTPGLWQPSASAGTKMARPLSRDWTSVHITPAQATPVEPTMDVTPALTAVPADKDVPPKYWGKRPEPKDFRDKQFFALKEYEAKMGLETSMSFAEFGMLKVRLELERSKRNAVA